MFLAEIDPTQLASLSVTSTTPSLVQLIAGGSAILSAPSAPLLSGKILKLLLTGRVQVSSGGANTVFSIYLGNSTISPILFNSSAIPVGSDSGSGSLTNNFVTEIDLGWDSVTEQIVQIGTGTIISPVSVQSAIEFAIGGFKSSGGDSNFTLTITEFKLKLV